MSRAGRSPSSGEILRGPPGIADSGSVRSLDQSSDHSGSLSHSRLRRWTISSALAASSRVANGPDSDCGPAAVDRLHGAVVEAVEPLFLHPDRDPVVTQGPCGRTMGSNNPALAPGNGWPATPRSRCSPRRRRRSLRRSPLGGRWRPRSRGELEEARGARVRVVGICVSEALTLQDCQRLLDTAGREVGLNQRSPLLYGGREIPPTPPPLPSPPPSVVSGVSGRRRGSRGVLFLRGRRCRRRRCSSS